MVVPRLSPSPSRPEDLLGAIIALGQQTTDLALRSSVEAAQADALGKIAVVAEQVCRLAIGAGVAAGEIGWLATELEASDASEHQRAEAVAAIASLQTSLLSVAFAVHDVADAGGPVEIRSAAEALSRASLGLEDRLAGLRREPVPRWS